jgi:ADP-heptose:LPS heptosyltransferase
VLRALGLGDLLTGIPALRGLRRAYPDAHIALAAPERYRDLALLTGAVDDVVPTERLGDIRSPASPPALAVNLHGRGPQSIDHLLSWRPDAVLTHAHEQHPEIAGPPWRADVHEVDRWCALLGWAGIDCDADDVVIARPDRDSAGADAVVVHPGADAVVVHPGAAAPARRWPVDRFAAVASALRSRGHDVVITGSAAEADLAHSVAGAARLPAEAVLAGRLDLPGLIALVHDCRLVICGDTGMAHVAAATGTPSVVLFGPTAPARWGPRTRAPHVELWDGNVGDPHADTPDPGLLQLTVPQVLSATDWVLAEAA